MAIDGGRPRRQVKAQAFDPRQVPQQWNRHFAEHFPGAGAALGDPCRGLAPDVAGQGILAGHVIDHVPLQVDAERTGDRPRRQLEQIPVGRCLEGRLVIGGVADFVVEQEGVLRRRVLARQEVRRQPFDVDAGALADRRGVADAGRRRPRDRVVVGKTEGAEIRPAIRGVDGILQDHVLPVGRAGPAVLDEAVPLPALEGAHGRQIAAQATQNPIEVHHLLGVVPRGHRRRAEDVVAGKALAERVASVLGVEVGPELAHPVGRRDPAIQQHFAIGLEIVVDLVSPLEEGRCCRQVRRKGLVVAEG